MLSMSFFWKIRKTVRALQPENMKMPMSKIPTIREQDF